MGRIPGVWLPALVTLLAACRGPGVTAEADGIDGGPGSIPLGMDADRLVASPDGRCLLAWSQEDHVLAVLDVRARREVRRIPMPVRTRDAAGEPTEGYVSRIALDDGAATAWAATTEGQLFRIDLATGDLRTVLDDGSHAFSDVVEDPERNRILLATEEGEILAFDGSRATRVVRTAEWGITRMKRSGPALHALSRPGAIWRSGQDESRLLTVDLAQDRIAAEALLETGIAADLAPLEGGRVLVADGGKDRIFQFASGWVLEITRETRGFVPSCIDADGDRVLVAWFGTPWSPVYEYGVVDGTPTLFPTARYEFPGETVLDVALLRDGRFAIALKGRNAVLLVPRSQALPFAGFPDR